VITAAQPTGPALQLLLGIFDHGSSWLHQLVNVFGIYSSCINGRYGYTGVPQGNYWPFVQQLIGE